MSSFLTRREFVELIAAGTAIGGLAIAGDGTILEANRPQLVTLEVVLPRLAESWDGFRIAQLSDLHYDEYFSVEPLRRAIDIVNRLEPDLVALTGDFVTSPLKQFGVASANAAAALIEPCARLLSQLRAHSGAVAVLGNHDLTTSPSHIIEVLKSHSIPVLRNRSLPIEREGKRLWFAGVDDVLEGKPDLKLALSGIPLADPVVLLAHEPDFADFAAHYPVDLQLSGHSHGGQIRLPLIGVPYLPRLGRRYPWGLRRIASLVLYTNVGVGTVRVPMRLNCPPEVTLFTLRVAKSAGIPHAARTFLKSRS